MAPKAGHPSLTLGLKKKHQLYPWNSYLLGYLCLSGKAKCDCLPEVAVTENILIIPLEECERPLNNFAGHDGFEHGFHTTVAVFFIMNINNKAIKINTVF